MLFLYLVFILFYYCSLSRGFSFNDFIFLLRLVDLAFIGGGLLGGARCCFVAWFLAVVTNSPYFWLGGGGKRFPSPSITFVGGFQPGCHFCSFLQIREAAGEELLLYPPVCKLPNKVVNNH